MYGIFKHPNVLSILSVVLVLLFVETRTIVISLDRQLAATHGEQAADNGVVTSKQAIICVANDRRALLDFKATTLWDPATNVNINGISTWGTMKEDAAADCCNWYGVSCNQEIRHVNGLNLDVWGLGGELSPSLLNLTHLTVLNLKGNSFNGIIPKWIGSLTELTYLDLSDNSFSGHIPQELGNLSNLQTLLLNDLGKNCTVESINWLPRLSHLESLNMKGISLAKANHWVNAILSLRNLTELNLGRCELSQVMLPYSTSSVNPSSSNISSISLRDNNLNSSMYTWLFPLTSSRLDLLALSGNKLDGIPKYFGNFCSLTYLDFTNNSAVVPFPDFLKNLSGCTSAMLYYLKASSNQFTGSIPDDIQNFSSLQQLNLAHNQLNGTVSEKLWDLPMLGSVDISFNSLRGAIFEKTGKAKPNYIDLSNNLFQLQLQGVPSKAYMPILSFVDHLDFSSCRLGPRFPGWIRTFTNLNLLNHLNIANNGISDTLPVDFLNMLPLYYLNLSLNDISGEVPDLLSATYGSVLDLSSNNFYGPIKNVSSSFNILNLSKNKFQGGISFLCRLVSGSITYLDLSYNSFSGQIPDCLSQLPKLKVLNLAHNNLSGRIPASVRYLIQLEVLYLYNNKLSGEMPLSLRNCSTLTFLDLGANRFSGIVPIWLAENLSGLYVLSLGSNDFFGTIPLNICQLVNLRILDLSMNNLNGNIPSCVNNLSSMLHEGFLSPQNVHEYDIPGPGRYLDAYDYVDQAMIQWQGIRREFTYNLGLLKSIDLSSNNLTGEIPNELTDLRGLLALNLSKNALRGEIPWAVGQMKDLLILDLSRNNCSGEIPSSMSQMTSLYDLDVSYNNLSGKIPLSTQLQSFESSRYIGNAGLCGLPLSKRCPGEVELQVPSPVGERDQGGDQGGTSDDEQLEKWFYIGGATGFAVGFWIVCIALLVISRGRHAFFHFLDTLENWIYVKALVFKSKFE